MFKMFIFTLFVTFCVGFFFFISAESYSYKTKSNFILKIFVCILLICGAGLCEDGDIKDNP